MFLPWCGYDATRRLPLHGISNKISNVDALETMRALTYSDNEQY